ncbi:sugar transferase [Megalodesulfovibrio paquesii]
MNRIFEQLSKTHAELLFTILFVLYDFLAVFASLFIVDISLSIANVSYAEGKSLFIFIAIAVLWLFVLASAGVFSSNKSFLNIEHSKRTLKGLCLVFCISLFVSSPFFTPSGMGKLFIAFTISSILIFYGHIYLHHHFLFLKKLTGKRILIYGAGHLGRTVYNVMASSRYGLIPIGFVDDNVTSTGKEFYSCGLFGKSCVQVLGSGSALSAIIRAHDVDQVLVAISNISNNQLNEIHSICKAAHVEFSFVPNLFNYSVFDITLTTIGEVPIVLFHAKPISIYPALKRSFDIIVSVFLMIAFFPLACAIFCAVYFQDWSSPFFSHERTGIHGTRFRMYKFRTMHAKSDPYAHTPASSMDDRITKIGRILRKTSLDELPQLFNVLRGDMSLVGPRPEMPFITENYSRIEKMRLQVKPGITGLWQISVDRNLPIHENLEYDLFYIRNCSFFLDLAIILETVAFLFRGI